MGSYLPGTVDDGLLFRFGKLCKAVQYIGMLCQFHRKADGKLFIIYHTITPMVGCAELRGNIQENDNYQEDLRMYGYIAGLTDTDEINFCPYCGEEIAVMHAGGTVTCGSCKRRFGVVELDSEEI